MVQPKENALRYSPEADFPRIATIIREGLTPLCVNQGLTQQQIRQLIEYSNSQDSDLQQFTHDCERFGNREVFNTWLTKERTVYTLSDTNGSLQGIAWFGKKQLPVADYQFPIHPSHYPYTQALRLYGETRGKHVAVEFATIAARHFNELTRSDDESRGVWIYPDASNKKIITTLCKSNPGFTQVSKPDEHNRIVLVSPSISQSTSSYNNCEQ